MINEYTKYYSTEGGMTAGFDYYRALKEDGLLVKTFFGRKLLMSVLAISGRYGAGDKLFIALKNETTFLKTLIINESGHFVAEEEPKIFNAAVIQFIEGRYQ